MPITKADAQGVARAFVRDYPGALELVYRFGANVAELYGPRAAEVPADMKGGYVPKETMHVGRAYRGRVDVPLQNVESADDLLMTLRHEVLGHYGANTFAPAEKRALLDGLVAARNEPTLKPLWDDVSRRYAGQPLDMRAEEVFALYCQGITPSQHLVANQVQQRGQQSFTETCIARVRPMRADDLHNIVCMVAQGLRDRTRMQQNFPQFNELFRRDEIMEPKKPFHEIVAEKLIAQLQSGTAPWQKAWEPGQPNTYLPMNPTTGNRYKGINAINLMAQGRSDARWMTYKQATAVGAQVRRGEKGTQVQYWKFSEEQDKFDDNGRPVLDGNGQHAKETVMLERPRVLFATVFNGEQIDGLPPLQPKKEQTWNVVERAEHLLKASGAIITHAMGDRAFYRPSTDSITLPEQGQFPSSDRYYATALHELGHWTGHPSRLDRDLAHPFGSEGYAKEELRAEIASMIVGDELGIGHDPRQHAAYVGSWIKVLRDDPLEVFRAAADAEKIHDYVLALEQKQTLERDVKMQVPQQTVVQNRDEMFSGLTVEREPGDRRDSDLLVDGASWWDYKAESMQEGAENDDEVSRGFADLGPRPAEGTQIWVNEYNSRIVERPNKQELKAQAQAPQAGRDAEAITQQPPGDRQYISVPFKEKDEAKRLGARWDRQEQSWYVPAGVNVGPFAKWAQGATAEAVEPRFTRQAAEAPTAPTQQARQYLAVPYEQRNEAKAAGAQWDKVAKSWYADSRADMVKLERWKPENVQAQQGPAMTPREEFAAAMRSAGLLTGSNGKGDHPIMDGNRHRVPVEGGKPGSLDGFYVGHLDGHPAGRIINNKTGTDITWKSLGYALSEQEKAKLKAEAAEKLAQRTVEQSRVQETTAQRVARQLTDLVPIEKPTPYLHGKGIQAHTGVMTDREGQKTYIPAFDVDGKQWTMQYIQEDGTKRFAADGRKEGCFHVVGGMNALATAPALVISEGYATAAQVAAAVGHATVAAFDSGNLEAVAKALHGRYPDKPVIIAGDDDRHLVMTHGKNPGREKAEAAAKAVGGHAIFPIFAPAENSYPSELPVITPEAYREHLQAVQRLADSDSGKIELGDDELVKLNAAKLNDLQLAALGRMKQHTDFNDLAQKSELGGEGVKRQVGTAIRQVEQQKQVRVETHQHERRRAARI